MSAIIQVWSAPSCQSGAVCFGALAPWVSAGGSEATGTPAGFRVTVPRDVADRASLAEGRCLRVLSQSRGEQWWFVSSVSDSDGDAGLVSVTAGALRQLLTVRGLVRSGSTFSFTPGRRTVSDLLNTYVLTNLSDDGLSWLSLGTVDFTDTLEIGALDRATRAGVLDAIEGQTGHTARLRALTSGGVLTGFAVDVVADVAAGLDTVMVPGVQQVQRTRDALRAATVVVPFSAGGAPLERTVWRVDTITGTAPAWLTLRDPVTGNPWPIREDDQLNGLYVEQRDGTQTLIADSRASDSAVQLGSVGTIVANDLVTLVADTTGAAVTALTSPTGLASSRGRLVGTVSTRVTDARRNYVQNGVFTNWTSDTAPTDYTVSAGAVGRYPRSSITANITGLQVDGAVVAGASTIPVRGGTAGARLYFNEYLEVSATVGYRITSNVVVFDGTGRASLPVTPTTPGAIADGASVVVFFTGLVAQGPMRPSSFPTEAADDVCRLLQQNTVIQSVASFMRTPNVQTITAAAGISIRSANSTAGLTATYFPSLLLRDTVGGTTLATATSPTAAQNAAAQYTLTTSATLAANTTVAARITSGTNVTLGSNFLQWQGVRWLSLWVGDAGAMTAQNGSGSNTLWHRAQDVLASQASGTRYVVKGVDLTRLMQDTGALALGQSVRLRSELLGVDTTVRIVKLDYDFAQTESLNLELGVVTPRLTGVTVTL